MTFPHDPDPVLPKRFRRLRALGSGAMGQVFEVFDLERGRRVALKTLHLRARRDYGEYLRGEFELLASLSHPNLPEVFDFFWEPQRAFAAFSCEFVDGETLERAADARPPLERLDLLAQLARALAFVHARGLAHLDVKPANILVGRGDGVLKLVDFGLALRLSATPRHSGGTPDFMAPEVYAGYPFDHRADLYGLGVIAYRLATGVLPKERDLTIPQSEIRQGAPPRPPQRPLSGIEEPWASIIEVFAREHPAQRPGSASEAIRLINERGGHDFALETEPTSAAYAVGGVVAGRDALLARVLADAGLRREHDGTRLVLLSGEAGAGKRAVIEELRRRVQLAGGSMALLDARDAPSREDLRDATRRRDSSAPEFAVLACYNEAQAATEDSLTWWRHREQPGDPADRLVLVVAEDGPSTGGPASRLIASLGDRERHEKLGPLDENGVHDLLRKCYGIAEAPMRVPRALHAITRGNPARLSALMRRLADQGVLAFDGDRWRLHEERLDALTLSGDLRENLARSMESLGADERALLRRLAIIDDDCGLAELAALTAGELSAARRFAALARLEAAGWLEKRLDERGMRLRVFNHEVRRALGGLESENSLGALHAARAEYLAAAQAAHGDVALAALVSHALDGGRRALARRFAMAALRAPSLQGDRRRARALLVRLEPIFADDDPDRAELLERLADAHERLLEPDQASRRYLEALECSCDRVSIARICRHLGNRRQDRDQARRFFERGLAALATLDEEAARKERVELRCDFAFLLALAGDAQQPVDEVARSAVARALLDAAQADLDTTSPLPADTGRYLALRLANQRAVLSLNAGDARAALSVLDQACAAADAERDALMLAGIEINRGVALKRLGKYQKALAAADHARRLREQRSEVALLRAALLNAGNAALACGAFATARGHLTRSLGIARAEGLTTHAGRARAGLARVEALLGHFDRADALYRQGRDDFSDDAPHAERLRLRVLHADLLWRAQRRDEALACLDTTDGAASDALPEARYAAWLRRLGTLHECERIEAPPAWAREVIDARDEVPPADPDFAPECAGLELLAAELSRRQAPTAVIERVREVALSRYRRLITGGFRTTERDRLLALRP